MASTQALGLLVQNQVLWRWHGSLCWVLHPPGGRARPGSSHWKGWPWPQPLRLPGNTPSQATCPKSCGSLSHLSQVCVCVCVCTCVNKENTLSSPGALSWPFPLPLLSLHKRLIPGRLCPPIYHCVPFMLHREYLLCSLMWLCFFSFFSYFICRFICLEQGRASEHDLMTSA